MKHSLPQTAQSTPLEPSAHVHEPPMHDELPVELPVPRQLPVAHL